MIQPPTFFAVEIEVYKPGLATFNYTQGHGTRPHGTLAMFPDQVQSVGTILASDMGYRTAPTDPGGVQAYPPIVSQAFTVDRKLNIDPTQSPIAAAWGSINLTNAGHTFDPIVDSWNSDNRNVRIWYGVKGYEDFEGQRVKRASTGTYFDSTRTLQTAAVDVIRYDWTTGSPVALIEAAATNRVTNPRCEGAVAGTPGTAPTGWSGLNTQAGLSRQILGIGYENGVPYIEVRMFGTSTGGAAFVMYPCPSPQPTNNLTSTSWSVYMRRTAGSSAGINTFQMYQVCYNAGGSNLSPIGVISFPLASLEQPNGLGGTRFVSNGQSGDPTAAFVHPIMVLYCDAVAIDCTFRIGAPQLEGSPASSVILPPAGAPAATTRAADYAYTARRYHTDPPKASLLPAFFGVCQPWFLSETELQVPIRDATYFAEMPLQTQLYGGTGGYDGTPALQGQPRPKARGGTAATPIRNVSPVLLDPPRLIYQYSDAPGTVVRAYEGGAAVWTYAGDTTDLYSGSPAAGSYRTDNSRGLFQLGSNPQRTVTVDVTGQFSGAGAVTSACQICRYLLTEELGVPPEHVNIPSFNLAAPDPGAGVAGVYWSPDTMPADGVTAVALVASSFAGHVVPNRQGLLTLILIRDIPSTATQLARFDTVNTVSMTPQALPSTVSPPAFRVRLAYGSNYTIMSSGISPAADTAQQQFVAGPGPSAVWVSQQVQQTWLRPNDVGILPSALLSLTDAQNVVNSLGALWGTRRRLFSCVVPVMMALRRDLGDIVRLVWPADILVQGALGRIVGESWSSTDGTITFLVLV